MKIDHRYHAFHRKKITENRQALAPLFGFESGYRYRIDGITDAPYKSAWEGKDFEHCPWIVFIGDEDKVYYLPLLCPVCGNPYHLDEDGLEKLSDELGLFEVTIIYYVNVLNPYERTLPKDEQGILEMLGHVDDDGKLTAQGEAVKRYLDASLEVEAPRAVHSVDEAAFPHYVLWLEKFDFDYDDYESVDDRRLRVHPASIAAIRVAKG